MVKESILGKMGEYMMENIKMIRSMDMGYTIGLMEEYTEVTGKMVNNMAKVNTLYQTNLRELVIGKTGKG